MDLKGFLWCCAVHLFPTHIGIRFSFPHKRNCRFVICLLILASWRCFKSSGEDLNLGCLKAAWKSLYGVPVSYHSSNYCFFSCYPACKIRGFFGVFLLVGLKVAVFSINASCFRQLPFGRDQAMLTNQLQFETNKQKNPTPKKPQPTQKHLTCSLVQTFLRQLALF